MASETVVNPKLERSEQIQPKQAVLEQSELDQAELEQTEPDQTEPDQTQQKHNIAWLRHFLNQVGAIKTFAIIYGVLIFCFAPYFIVMTLRSIGYVVRVWTVSNQLTRILRPGIALEWFA